MPASAKNGCSSPLFLHRGRYRSCEVATRFPFQRCNERCCHASEFSGSIDQRHLTYIHETVRHKIHCDRPSPVHPQRADYNIALSYCGTTRSTTVICPMVVC